MDIKASNYAALNNSSDDTVSKMFWWICQTTTEGVTRNNYDALL